MSVTKRRNFYPYGHEQLSRAVSYLETQYDTPAKRLENVVVDNLDHITPDVDLPEELRDEFIEMMERFGKVWGTSQEEGTLARAVRTMTEGEVRSTIDTVTDLYRRLCEETGFET